MFKLSAVLLSAALMFYADDAHKHTHTYLYAYTTSFIVHPFLANVRAVDSPSFSSCLGKQRAFSNSVRQKDKQFVVTIVLPANSQDLAVPSKQLRETKTLYVMYFPLSFDAEPQNPKPSVILKSVKG